MGCCVSSPHQRRVYRDPADLDEVIVPLRYFGKYRNNSNLVPDDIDGLPSTHILEHLASNADNLLYEGEIDHGKAFRLCRPLIFAVVPCFIPYALSVGCGLLHPCICDETCCYVRKEYTTRTFFRVYPNRIVANEPDLRVFGMLGCGSWSSDQIVTHPFDRGAFGFRRVNAGILEYGCCLWPVFGGVVARQRCQCNGPLWNRMFTDCGGWWCDEWCCDIMCCSYRYRGLANADEVAFAASLALQAYFEGRVFTREDMDKCLAYWHDNISEMSDPEGRKRDVCCEPHSIPVPQCSLCYRCTHPERNIPYDEETEQLKEIYDKYEEQRQKQIKDYENFHGPVRNSTACRTCGCRRVFGRRGFIFCTEGCDNCSRKAGDPAPPFKHRDIDDENDASKVLQKVLGNPPRNVVYNRWEHDEETNEYKLVRYPPEGNEPLELLAAVNQSSDSSKAPEDKKPHTS